MIICLTGVQVVCDDCKATITLDRWQDAPKVGWTAPIDGAFQRCPKCAKARSAQLFAQVQIAAIAKKCPIINADDN